LEPRRRAEKAPTVVIQEADVQRVSTRSVDDLGMTSISKSQVSRLSTEIDAKIAAFLNRPLEGNWPIFGVAVASTAMAGGKARHGHRDLRGRDDHHDQDDATVLASVQPVV
jgi:hypothetical protein